MYRGRERDGKAEREREREIDGERERERQRQRECTWSPSILSEERCTSCGYVISSVCTYVYI